MGVQSDNLCTPLVVSDVNQFNTKRAPWRHKHHNVAALIAKHLGRTFTQPGEEDRAGTSEGGT